MKGVPKQPHSTYPFPGPDPDMSAPDPQEVLNAEISLKRVQHENKRSLKTGLTPARAETLLKYIVHTQRQYLASKFFSSEEEFRTSSLKRLCGISAGQSKLAGKRLKLEMVPIAVQLLFIVHQSNSLNHGTAVITLPVEREPGKPVNEYYLIDTTFRQFFVPDQSSIQLENNIFESPGHKITKSKKGTAIADALLKKGFIQLDEEVARLYTTSFINREPPDLDYLAVLLKPFIRLDFYPDDMAEIRKNTPDTPLNRFRAENKLGDVKKGRGRE